MCKRRHLKRASLSIGVPLGTGRGLIVGDFERQMKEGSGNGASLSMAALRGKPGEKAPLIGALNYI
jgi:hypothetical protein